MQLVSAQEMERFCAMIAEAIHLNSGKMATVGSACLKWSSLRQPPAEAHYWCDSSFQAVYKKPEAFLDFYEIHYYDWMFNADWGYDPFQAGKTPAYWKLDKPTLIGESPAQAGQYTMRQMVDSAFAHGYAGIMPWSYNANDGIGTWDACKSELKTFHDAHASLVDFICNAGIAPGNGKNSSKPNHWAFEVITGSRGLPLGIKVKVYNMQGRLVWARQVMTVSGIKMGFPLKGTFLYQIIDENDKVIYSGKAVNFLD